MTTPESIDAGAAGSIAALSESVIRLLNGESRTPHDILGAHPVAFDGQDGVVVRARYPGATAAWVVVDGESYPMVLAHRMLFVLFLRGRSLPLRYRLRFTLASGESHEIDDPYRFAPTLGAMDLHLFGEGRHLRLWEKLGAHPRTIDGVNGVSFAVWAPNATRVSVIGVFNDWDARTHVMRVLGDSGVFELFVPGVKAGAIYKYEIRSPQGALRVKTDPYAGMMEQAPGHAAIVVQPGGHVWEDSAWLARRTDADPLREPMLIYEVHLASWMRGDDNRLLTYLELAPKLALHVKRLGFTHVELMPVQEHPFGGSWGYQVGGYYAPTSRHGTPDEFRRFVDILHQAGVGVLLDWVPAHFPKDDWALRRFDGTACYEHADPRLGEHAEWGTMIFNYARHEVRNFLLANALYWVEEFHIDGIRVDAVASMLYLDYGREAGQWLRNRYGGRENLEAVSFLKQLNHTLQSLHPGVVTIAEESTTWPRVTHPIADGGLGFTFKWNMGWMHDTLDYFHVDPFFRRGAHDKLTFALMYEYSERFVNPLSHDEVVHLKKSLLEKMPGDTWQRFANLRALLGYTITRPGKSLLFMGTELAPQREWNHDASLEWHLATDPRREGIDLFLQELGALYNAQSSFWRRDQEPAGFSWIDVADKEQSVLAYARFDGIQHAVVVLNLTPVPRSQYRIGAPMAGAYRYALNSDAERFGGSGFPVPSEVTTDPHPYHGFAQSMELMLPPLSMLILLPDPMPAARALSLESFATRADDGESVSKVSNVTKPKKPKREKLRSERDKKARAGKIERREQAAREKAERKQMSGEKKAKARTAKEQTAKGDTRNGKPPEEKPPNGKPGKEKPQHEKRPKEKPRKEKQPKPKVPHEEPPIVTKRARTKRPPTVPPGHPPALPRVRRGVASRFVLLGVIAAAVAIVCVRLGIWQLHRLAERRTQNAFVLARSTAPAVSISALQREDTSVSHWRHVRVRGIADYRAELVHATRSQNGSPGVHLLTPVRPLDGAWGDTAVLLLRGFLAAPDGRTIDWEAAREADTVEFDALITVFPPHRAGNVRMPSASRAVRVLDRDTLSTMMGRPLAPFVLLVLGDTVVRDVKRPARIPPPSLGEGTHKSYAFQWFGFAAVAIGGFVALVMTDRTQSAKVRSAADEAQARRAADET